MGIVDYFDLNKRAGRSSKKPTLPTKGNKTFIVGGKEIELETQPFSRRHELRASTPGDRSSLIIENWLPPSPKPMPVWKQLLLYPGILIGVIFSSAIMQLMHGNNTKPSFSLIGILVSAVIALAIIPIIYEKAVKPDADFLPQLGLFVQHGVFWSVLLEAVSKAL